jgi:hypothetical protein
LRYPHAVLSFGDSFMQVAKFSAFTGGRFVIQTRFTAALYPFPIIVLGA